MMRKTNYIYNIYIRGADPVHPRAYYRRVLENTVGTTAHPTQCLSAPAWAARGATTVSSVISSVLSDRLDLPRVRSFAQWGCRFCSWFSHSCSVPCGWIFADRGVPLRRPTLFSSPGVQYFVPHPSTVTLVV